MHNMTVTQYLHIILTLVSPPLFNRLLELVSCVASSSMSLMTVFQCDGVMNQKVHQSVAIGKDVF